MASIFNRHALLITLFLTGFVVFSENSIAETALSPFKESSSTDRMPKKPDNDEREDPFGTISDGPDFPREDSLKNEPATESENPAGYIATAYSLRGRTSSGQHAGPGIIAADPKVLPLGSRVRLDAGMYSGEYLVADTGNKMRGRKIDIWIPSPREALKFGRRNVKLTVLKYGRKHRP